MWPFRTKDNPAWRSILAVFGFSKGPVWKTVNYAALTEAGYKNCATVFACVSMIAKSASRISWILSKKAGKGNWNEFDEHPLLDLLARPNEFDKSGIRFTEKAFSFLLLNGNSYIHRQSGIASAPPIHLYSLRPDRMTINKSGDWKSPIASYDYSAGAKPETFDPRLILHLTEFHPLDDWYGLSRISVAAHHVDISNQAMEWNKKLLANDMRVPGVVTSKSTFDIEKLKEMFRENYMGAENAGTPIVLEGEDIKWQDITVSPKDVDWLNGQKFTMRQICAIFGVPSQLLGDTEAVTYANYQEARKAVYMETILPLMDIYRDDLNAWLVPLYGDGLRLDYDRDAIEALQEERGKKYAYLAQADWLTLNEKRVATGFDEIVGGDVILVPISSVPLEEATAPPQPMPDFTPSDDDDEDEPDDEPEDDTDEDEPAKSKPSARRVIKAVKKSFWTDPERKERLWTTFEARVSSRSKSFREMAKDYMRAQGERVRQRLNEIGSLPMSAENVLDLEAETKEYVKKFYAWYKDAYLRAGEAGVRATKGELLDDSEWKADKPTSWVFQMTAALEAKLRNAIFHSGTLVNETTIATIYQILQKAQAENMTVAEFGQAIWDKIGEFSRSRAMLWSRTESARVDNMGQVDGYRQVEFVDNKIWICSFVPTSRDEHIAADGQEVSLDAGFIVGGESLDYPGDPKGSAANTCNCLCSTAPSVGVS